VQQSGRNGLGANAQIGENLRNRYGMRNLRLAALALLARVSLLGRRVRALNECNIGFGVVRSHRLDQTIDGT